MIYLDPRTTALVLIDLRKGIVGSPLAPHTGLDVVNVGADLARRFRKAGSPVILVNVAFAKDLGDALRQPVDRPRPIPPGGFPDDFSDLVDGLAESSDLRITKRQWGAFHGTDLDLQLRHAGSGRSPWAASPPTSASNRRPGKAYEHGYEVVIAEDATTSRSAEMHAFSVGEILPSLARVSPSSAIGPRQD